MGQVELDSEPVKRLGTDGSYSEAMEQVSLRTGMSKNEINEYMKANKLTWHECADGKTVQAIPTELNAAYSHTGGISVNSGWKAMKESLYEKFGGREIKLTKSPYDCNSVDRDIRTIQKNLKKHYSARRRKIK